MILPSNTAATVEAGMAKPIHTSSQKTVMSSREVATTKMPVTHTPNKQATPTLHSPLHHNKPMGVDSNKGATVRPMLGRIFGRELMVLSWRKRC